MPLCIYLTSNLCRSSSLPSSPSGWTGTLKYSPSSWDSSLYLKTKTKHVRQNQDYHHVYNPVPSACSCRTFPNLPSYHPSMPCFCSSEIPKDRDPMKSFLLVKSQSQTSTERRRSLSLSLRLLKHQRITVGFLSYFADTWDINCFTLVRFLADTKPEQPE